MMTDLLQIPDGGARGVPPVYDGWHVHGTRFAHSAAKFWPRLLDEARAAYPSCGSIELCSPGGGILTRNLLYPERALERNLERLAVENSERELESAVAELELLGLPAGVQVRLLADDESEPLHEQILDAVDEEILPNLLAWLLEWARIADLVWNSEFVHGSFDAHDRDRRLLYRLALDLRNQLLSEDLYRRTIRLGFRIERLSPNKCNTT